MANPLLCLLLLTKIVIVIKADQQPALTTPLKTTASAENSASSEEEDEQSQQPTPSLWHEWKSKLSKFVDGNTDDLGEADGDAMTSLHTLMRETSNAIKKQKECQQAGLLSDRPPVMGSNKQIARDQMIARYEETDCSHISTTLALKMMALSDSMISLEKRRRFNRCMRVFKSSPICRQQVGFFVWAKQVAKRI